ncbi:hypothetical protein ES708_01563 [subsurface metagenome]
MYFMTRIIEYLEDIEGWFLDAYYEVRDWAWPFKYLKDPLYSLKRSFGYLATYFETFDLWLEWADDQLDDIFSWSTIRSYIRTWLPDLEKAIDWWDRWWIWVGQEVDDWWQPWWAWIRGEIDDLENWALLQIDNAVENITQVVTNIYDYSQTTINNFTEYVTEVWNNFYDYSQTTINNFTENISQFITNINDYTQTTINNVTEFITEVIDWDRVTKALDDWWADRLLDLQGLIDSDLKTWFPFYDDLVSLWNDIVDFFTNPLDWLKDRIEVWFWGGEE